MTQIECNKVLLVDDDPAVLEATRQWLELSDIQVITLDDPLAAEEYINADFPGVLVSDIRMPGISGTELMARVQAKVPGLPIILITGHGDIPMAVEAMRNGAWDFLEKPFDPERLEEIIRKALITRALQLENNRLRAAMHDPVNKRLLGNSQAIVTLRQQVQRLGKVQANILIHGETGAGKEAVARSLHECSPRADKPFVAINCGALTHELVESELFGHRKGAFTGAVESREGKLELASGGTLFLDEIESMPLPVQIKLLRAIQEQQVERIGSNHLIDLDLIIISATKIDLLELSEQGQFREDLYYRLAVAELNIPPLRERQEDILMLFQHFIYQAAEVHDLEIEAPDTAYTQALLQNPWRGNVRELRNKATRYALGLESQASPQQLADTPSSLAVQLEDYERNLIRKSLICHKGNVQRVMEELQLPRRTLNQKMLRLGLQREALMTGSDEA
ncbi:C4-dicarboxylate ABC transporter [Nitrincola sp. A-D6]|uniref:sigma-54-dependent transcriptional regulator n=1 Tax=Nitrincola sp. A-D6 TaxID=1545442 RepID=UPI00051FBFA4|nr:sigma-54 dependent transcriptional regulator [Nitrincola sp. A-D6]KGK41073.1 C4-dicarboxylate ABC transporter [Nitrincola sp. A-D6]